jgi:hypothetical protein
VFYGLTGDALPPRLCIRKFFVKRNEALAKKKPRGITAMSDETAMLQAMTIRIIGDAIFREGCLEDYSIKHADLDGQAQRFAHVLERFKTGGCMSVDFGSWDSTIQAPLRAAAENAFFNAFYRVLAPRDPLVKVATSDRNLKKLKMDGEFFHVDAVQFGRQSGDGGTSTLNYVTNFVVSLWVEHTLLKLARPNDVIDRYWVFRKRLSGQSSFASIHEGDDTVLLFGKRLLADLGGTAPAAEQVCKLYGRLHLNIEPAVVGGVTDDYKLMIVPPTTRFEFVSRIWNFDGAPFSIPKIQKAIRSASVTFSKGDLADLAFSSGRSGCYNSASCPIMSLIYKALLRIGALRGGQWVPTAYKHRLCDTALLGTTLEAYVDSAAVNHDKAFEILATETGMSVISLHALADGIEGCLEDPESSWDRLGALVASLF